jgi:NAD(P)-dependent dehydrogenase (short-subunit alcohol dehydrogenase family)
MYAKLGANVVVNDMSKDAAEAVVAEITKAGGKAAAAVCSAEEGQQIVDVAINTFGGLHGTSRRLNSIAAILTLNRSRRLQRWYPP